MVVLGEFYGSTSFGDRYRDRRLSICCKQLTFYAIFRQENRRGTVFSFYRTEPPGDKGWLRVECKPATEVLLPQGFGLGCDFSECEKETFFNPPTAPYDGTDPSTWPTGEVCITEITSASREERPEDPGDLCSCSYELSLGKAPVGNQLEPPSFEGDTGLTPVERVEWAARDAMKRLLHRDPQGIRRRFPEDQTHKKCFDCLEAHKKV